VIFNVDGNVDGKSELPLFTREFSHLPCCCLREPNLQSSEYLNISCPLVAVSWSTTAKLTLCLTLSINRYSFAQTNKKKEAGNEWVIY